MAKQLNINMAFSADTSQAKKQIADLQTQLSNLMASSSAKATNNINNEIQQNIQSVAKLKMALSEAMNTKTGTLDLTKFNTSLSDAGVTIKDLASDMSKLGPEGVKAFANVASSISLMEAPMKRTNALLDSFWTALKNSARWQISSSILHELTGAIQGAYNYAQDLNKSLTDIAIVTNQNIDQMGAFAEKANKAAQALSVTTTAYTDASLIYFQQGLDEDEVDARTETTLKMSNVTGETVDEVSSYMTAIWNNFADGSDNLELFADKITALGAATASSSKEIAEGLNQFASLGSSLGLSYDNATSALATIVAQTRQSASTVGNSLRTILQRFQNVSLGDTLEDDVDLTKYTKALKTAGVDILDVNGEMRDLNDIINDLGSAWQNLTKAQKSALAGTVAGVRNSNTLIAWMDNFDTFQDNLKVAINAEGSLQEQADTYAQSWEAARKRVKAAWQAIYSDIIDDDFFITLNDVLTDVLQLVDRLIDGFGGLPALITNIGVVFASVFKDKIASGLNDLGYNLGSITESGRQKRLAEQQATKEEWMKNAQSAIENNNKLPNSSNTRKAQSASLEGNYTVIEAYNNKLNQMSDKQKVLNKLLIEQYQNLTHSTEELAKQIDLEEQKSKEQKKKLIGQRTKNDNYNESGAREAFENIEKTAKSYGKEIKELTSAEGSAIDTNGDKALEAWQNFNDGIKGSIEELSAMGIDTKGLQKYSEGLVKIQDDSAALQIALDKIKTAARETADTLAFGAGNTINWSQAIVSAASMMGSVVTAIGSVNTIWETLNNQDLSGFEKITTVISTLSMTIGVLSMAWNKENIEAVKNIGIKLTQLALQERVNKSKAIALTQSIVQQGVEKGSITLEKANKLLQIAKVELYNQEASGSNKVTIAEIAQTVATKGLAAVTTVLAEAIESLKTTILPVVAVIGSLYLAFEGLKYLWENFTPSGKAEKAANELEKAQKAAEEAKTAYEDLTTAINNYKTAKEEIADMDDGTEKTLKVLEANKAILEQLEDSELLSTLGTLEYDEDGLIQITEAQQQLLKNEEMKEYYSALRLENEKKIISLNADADKEASNYKGPKIEILAEQTGEHDASTAGTITTANELKNQDKTTEIVDTLVEAGLTLTSVSENEEKVKEALDQAGYNEEQIASVIEQLKDNVDNTNLADFFSQRAELAGTAQAYEEQEKASKVGAMQVAFAGYSTQMEDAGITDTVYALFADLSDSVREAILNNLAEGKTLQEAYETGTGGSYGDVQGVIDQDNKSKIKLNYSSELDPNSLVKVQSDVENFINGMSSEDLKIAINADFSNIDSLDNAKKAFEEAKQSVANLDEMLDTDDDYYEDNEEAINNMVEALKQFEESEEKLGKDNDGILNDIVDNEAAMKKLAKSILRFDDAIQDVEDNYDDWLAQLESGTIQDNAEACAELQDTYGNLLDMDGSQLSKDFLSDTENLNLMQEAINGNEEAYNQLALNAAQDIVKQVTIDDEEARQEFFNLTTELNNYAAENNLEVGATIDDQGFIEQLNNMITATGMTADQVQAYLASMGYTATVHEVDPEEQTYAETNQYWVPATYKTKEYTTGGEEDPHAYYALEENTPGHWESVTSESTEVKPGATSVQIDTLTYTGGGGIKYNNASHGGGSKKSGNKGSGNKGSGNKGSGSKAGSKKQHKEAKESVKEKDRYHNIKEKIEDVSDALDKLDDASDRAWGKPKLKLMDQAIAKQKEQISLTDEYIKEIKQYAKTDKNNLIQVMKDLGMTEQEIASQFGKDGVLKDYEGLLDRIQSKFDETGTNIYNSVLARYNAAVDAYNAGSRTDSSAVDALSEELEAAEETYNNRKDIFDKQKEYLEQYEDTINLLQEKEAERIELLNELYDSQLSQLTTKIELQVSLNEDELDQAEWYLDALGDKADKAADRIASLNKQLEINQKNIELNKNALKEIFSLHGVNVDIDNLNGNNIADVFTKAINQMQTSGMTVDLDTVIDQIADYRDNLRDAYDNIVDIQEEITDNVIDAYDEWNEKLEDNLDLLDHYDTIIDSYKEIADLLGTDTLGLGDTVAIQYEQAKLKNYQDAAAAAKDSFDAIHEQLIKAQAQLANATSEAEKEHWQEVVDEVAKMEEDAEEEYLSRWQSALEQAEEMYNNSIERNTNAYKKALGSGSSTLDNLQEEIDRQKTINDLHLEDYQKYKRLGDLSTSINQSLAKNPNVKIQQKLNNLLDDVNSKMADGVEISEGEATILEKRLALLQAEDQLQAARNSKSAVRLTRDNEGNFSYTYTADTSAIEDAQQNYADKFNELLEYEKEYSEQVQDSMLNAWQEFIDKRNSILEDDMLSDSERNEALAKLKSDYEKIVSSYTDELEMITTEMSRLKTEDWKDIEQTIGRILASDSDFETSFDQTMLGKMVNADWATAADLMKAWQQAADECYTADAEAYNKWKENNEATNNAVDTSTSQVSQNYVSNMNKMAESSDKVAESTKTMAEQMNTSMDDILANADNFFVKYGNYLDDLLAKINSITEALNDMEIKMADVGYTTTGDTQVVKAQSFDTGGYTGSWGTTGKLAVLHQKEMVLNQNDTSNLLSTIGLVKEIVGNFSNNFIDAAGRLNYSGLSNVSSGSLDQNVQIQANFPNVVDHNEIELALNNLVNSASQYVNKK